MRKIKKLVLHCSDSCDSLDFGAKEIDRWHREDNGWDAIGYHYVIRRNGRVERGRPDEAVGAHVKDHNKRSIGIVWVGRKTPTLNQYSSIINLLAYLKKKYKIELENILGHCELDDYKTCPNLDMNRVRGDVLFTDYNIIKETFDYVPDRSPFWK